MVLSDVRRKLNVLRNVVEFVYIGSRLVLFGKIELQNSILV
jgi:hypothetical protein